jgi:anaerobic selenocysteine-containing dehydrogenase
VYSGLEEDPRGEDREALTLTTIRSHDQYNTTIYGLNDRYRGITGRRDVVFVNERDLASRGLKHGDLVDVSVAPDAGSAPKPCERVMRNLTAVAYNIAQGSIAAYYPEANVLVALDHYDVKSGTPSYKSTPVLLRASPNHEVLLRLVQAPNEYTEAK